MKKYTLQKNKGFTLVETLVAIAIFTMAILSMFAVFASSISSTNYAKSKITAEYLAQEGIEYARNLRDSAVLNDSATGWETFKSTGVDYPITDLEFIGYDRSVTMGQVAGQDDEVTITSTVTWRQGNYSITFSEKLFNWLE
jgi:Tfp pilus assembly protein PilV